MQIGGGQIRRRNADSFAKTLKIIGRVGENVTQDEQT